MKVYSALRRVSANGLDAVQTRISRSVREKTDLNLDRQNTEQHIKTLDKQDELLREKAVNLKTEKDRLKKSCANKEQILTDAERKEARYSTFNSTGAKVAYVLFTPIIVLPALLYGMSKGHETARSNVEDAREHLSSTARKLDHTKRVLQETQCSIESGRDSKGRCEGKVKALKEQTDGVYTDLKSLTMQETRIKRQITLCGEYSNKFQHRLEQDSVPLSQLYEDISCSHEHTYVMDQDDDVTMTFQKLLCIPNMNNGVDTVALFVSVWCNGALFQLVFGWFPNLTCLTILLVACIVMLS
ncbi:uncharacterized protein LOC124275308 [Haliotis rubra]|uniref:uncharacterized protein LOC124275308 n=1 Tax=Haliotis rubra TaxID=36100 RepID=UPI001EE51919|nr:uncharacterized protein LOC124275308 [Haliotis rubra]XP_046566771.1 uncharacterized protein LOC124275308 [Haliotis rubra]XP_046566777.1 uncharacterized protein LOC124275308 [Haliotis rubra]